MCQESSWIEDHKTRKLDFHTNALLKKKSSKLLLSGTLELQGSLAHLQPLRAIEYTEVQIGSMPFHSFL